MNSKAINKMKKRTISETERQFYTLFKKLIAVVPNEGDAALLIGYSIITSLSRYKLQTSSRIEQAKFEEIKAVFSGLEDTIQRSSSEGVTANSVLYGLQAEVEQIIASLTTQPAESNKSRLLIDIATKFKPDTNYINRIRKSALSLYYAVQSERAISGTRNILERNYMHLKGYFLD